MKGLFWTVVGIGIGAVAAYLILKPGVESQASFPMFVMKKAKGSINDEVFAGVETNEDEKWI
ncbi:MAG: hypothetical protein QME58_07960 [Bacteroidota bacterium]|nr:hypothetical protein [Bacteroidota bacterium]